MFSIYSSLVALSLHCCVWAFSSYGKRGLLFIVVPSFLTEAWGLSCYRAGALELRLQELWLTVSREQSLFFPIIILFRNSFLLLYVFFFLSFYLFWLQECQTFLSSVLQLYPTLCSIMDCSPSGSSVLEIFQARILEWGAISYFSGSPEPEIKPKSPALADGFFSTSAIWKLQTFLRIQTKYR